MGNIFKIKVLRYMPKWLAFLIDVSVVSVLYFFLNTLNMKVDLIGNQNEKIFSVITVTILFVLLLKTEKGIIRHFVSFDLSKIVWFSVSAFVVFPGLSLISEFALDKPVYLFSVLFFFFLVFLIFFSEPQPDFLRENL